MSQQRQVGEDRVLSGSQSFQSQSPGNDPELPSSNQFNHFDWNKLDYLAKDKSTKSNVPIDWWVQPDQHKPSESKDTFLVEFIQMDNKCLRYRRKTIVSDTKLPIATNLKNSNCVNYCCQGIPWAMHFRELPPSKYWLYSDLTLELPGPPHFLKIPQDCPNFWKSSAVVANVDVAEEASKPDNTDSGPAMQLIRRGFCPWKAFLSL